MARPDNGRVHPCVVVDLNTQIDFCDPAGVRPVANLEQMIKASRRMVAWTKRNQAPIVSSVESHRPDEFDNCGQIDFCIDNSYGQQKIPFTLFDLCARVEVDNTLACPLDLFQEYQQIIFRKRSEDLLANPKADRFFSQVPTNQFIVFGVSLEGAVKSFVLGLLAREKKVTVVSDACGYWDYGSAELALRQMATKGADFCTLETLLARKLERGFRYRRRRVFRRTFRSGCDAALPSRSSRTQRCDPSVSRLPNKKQDAKMRRSNGRSEGS